jgi:hypothetical protein
MLAVVPSTPNNYEALPLFTIPRSRREMVLLSALSHTAFLLNARHSLLVDPETFVAIGRTSMVMLLYVPALFLVLRRPNVGRVPTWLESASSRLPIWLRGQDAQVLKPASH